MQISPRTRSPQRQEGEGARNEHNYLGRAITRSIGFNFRFTFRRITQEISAACAPPPCTSGSVHGISQVLYSRAHHSYIGITGTRRVLLPGVKARSFAVEAYGESAAGLSSSCTLNPMSRGRWAQSARQQTDNVGSGPLARSLKSGCTVYRRLGEERSRSPPSDSAKD